jgi:predicted transcriptional regulator
MQYTRFMKTATIPAVRIEPDLREQLEQVLQDGESLSAFVEASVRDAVRHRLDHAEFVARGMASINAAKHTGRHVSAAQVVSKLQARLAKARR